jgi:hypothetical protein
METPSSASTSDEHGCENREVSIVRLEVKNDVVDPEAIDVWIDGHIADEAVRFRLDTGAGTCRVGISQATDHLPSHTAAHSVAASGVGLDEDEIVIPLLRLGEHELVDIEATRTSLGPNIVPLLGMSALARHRCQFRFATGELELSDSSGPSTDGWIPLVVHAAGQPSMAVRFGDLEVTGCWDTGAGLTAVDAGFARSHPYLFEPLRSAVGIDASGTEIPSELSIMAACAIGDVEFPTSVCALVDLSELNEHLRLRSLDEQRHYEPMLFVIGMPLIQHADWDFDFPASKWAVRRSA